MALRRGQGEELRSSKHHRPARQVSRYCGRAAGARVDEPRAHADQIWSAIAADDPRNLPQPSRLGATRTGGIDLNKPRIRAALAAALALAAARAA